MPGRGNMPRGFVLSGFMSHRLHGNAWPRRSEQAGASDQPYGLFSTVKPTPERGEPLRLLGRTKVFDEEEQEA